MHIRLFIQPVVVVVVDGADSIDLNISITKSAIKVQVSLISSNSLISYITSKQ